MSAALTHDLSTQHPADPGRSSQRVAPVAANDAAPSARTLLRFITCGSVDDGKSTLIGRLLHETNAIFEDQLAALDRDSSRFGTTGGRDYALLVDGLSAEREQGITIDVAYRYFATPKRSFIVADTPGHEQYTRNMATGASTADLAIILIDASKGVLPQTRRHSLIASMLGVRHAVIAVNKMDLVAYDEERFRKIRHDYDIMTKALAFDSITFIPLAAREGDNIASLSPNMPWHRGPTLLDALENADVDRKSHRVFRFPVQYVSRPSADFRGYAGVVASGRIAVGDEVRALPSGRTSTITRIATADGDLECAVSGQTPTLCLADELDISRGDMIVMADDSIRPRHNLTAHILNTAELSLEVGQVYILKAGGIETQATVTALHHAVDIEGYGAVSAESLAMNGVGLVSLTVDRAVVGIDYATDRMLGGFILIDRLTHETAAFGMVDLGADTRGLGRTGASVGRRNHVFERFMRWSRSGSEQPRRSLLKAITWRTTGTLDTFALSWFFTGSIRLAAAISTTEVITKLALYYGHERIWARINFGLASADRNGNTDGGGI